MEKTFHIKRGQSTTDMYGLPMVVDLGGSIILVPGRAVVTDTTTVMGASSSQFSFMWEEIDE